MRSRNGIGTAGALLALPLLMLVRDVVPDPIEPVAAVVLACSLTGGALRVVANAN